MIPIAFLVAALAFLLAGNTVSYGAGQRRVTGYRSDVGFLIGLLALAAAFAAGRLL